MVQTSAGSRLAGTVERRLILVLDGVLFQRVNINRLPIRENGTIIKVQTPQPNLSRNPPRRNPVKPAATYCTPSRSPVTVAAALVPPKSMEAVPESIPWTPKIHKQVIPIIKEAAIGVDTHARMRSEMIWPM